jgi:hypothetical protein
MRLFRMCARVAQLLLPLLRQLRPRLRKTYLWHVSVARENGFSGGCAVLAHP